MAGVIAFKPGHDFARDQMKGQGIFLYRFRVKAILLTIGGFNCVLSGFGYLRYDQFAFEYHIGPRQFHNEACWDERAGRFPVEA